MGVTIVFFVVSLLGYQFYKKRKIEKIKARWLLMLDTMPGVVCLVNAHGIIERANIVIEKWCANISVKKIKGMSLHQLLHEGCNGDCPIGQALHSQYNHEYYDELLDRYIEVSSFPYEDHLIVYLKDITEKKKSQEYITYLMKQQDDVYGSLISTTHTIKNLIPSVRGFFEIIEREKGRPEMINDIVSDENYLKSALSSLDDMSSLMHALLDSAKPGNIVKCDFNMVRQLANVLTFFKMCKECRTINIEDNLAGLPPLPVNGISLDFRMVMMNILNNAKDEVLACFKKIEEDYFNDSESNENTSNGKSIEEINAFMEEKHIVLSVTARDGVATISLSNRGRLIPDDLKERIFEKGVSFKEQGNGLGLYDSRRIVEAMGGSIVVEDFGSRGATFLIDIPVQKK